MTTLTTSGATADLAEGGALLVAEIEHYLERRARATAPATAHPLVTKTTAALMAEATATLAGSGSPAPALAAPPAWLRFVPPRVLRRARRRGVRALSVAEHLELTALLIQRDGWTQGTTRTRTGRRCIAGAQTVLHHLGYGDTSTVAAAGRALDATLAARGERGPYWQWNEQPGRTAEQVLDLIRTTAATAERTR